MLLNALIVLLAAHGAQSLRNTALDRVVPASCDWALADLFHVQRKGASVTCRRVSQPEEPTRLANRVRCIRDASISSEKLIVPELSAKGAEGAAGLIELLSRSPSPDSPRVVDIGCGLAMYHVNIAAFFGGRSEHWLVDRSNNQVGQKKDHGYSKSGGSGFAFYNSLECAEGILSASGVNSSRIHLVNATSQNVENIGAGSADFVMSVISMGYHYPIAVYVNAIAAVLKPVTGRLMFTVSSWGRPLDQHKSLKRNGFTCTGNFAGFVVCCKGCRAEALLAPRSRLKLQELSF